MATNGTKIPTKDVFLTPEERYEVWVVKAAERPELLLYDDDDDDDDGCDDNSSSVRQPPLQDGCDIPGWRKIGMVIGFGCSARCSSNSENGKAILRVGPGCSMLRRERQLPVVAGMNYRSRLPNGSSKEEPRFSPQNNIIRLAYDPNMSIHPWFERENVPVLLEGCTDDWTLPRTLEQWVERYGDLPWRFSDTHGETMTLQTYYKYCTTSLEGLTDDAPLAIYDSQFALDERCELLNEYTVPHCFDADLFDLLENETDCPPYRWILMGPERSGTGLHIDPVGTHAWVTLLSGRKRWILFPPETNPQSIFLRGPDEPPIPSVLWFRDYYSRALHSENANRDTCIEVVQVPGETVYVPAGWPHAVWNLETSVAVTHNYASEHPSLDRLYQAVTAAEPRFAARLHQAICHHRPDLVAATVANSVVPSEQPPPPSFPPQSQPCAQ